MAFRGFRLNVTLRAVLLCALASALAWSLLRSDWQMTPIVVTALLVIATIDLVRYVERVNRELAGFLEFIAHHDFKVDVSIASKGKTFEGLEAAYNVLAKSFRELNREKAADHQYFASIVEHVNTALISLDQNGTVTLMNRRAKELLNVPHLQSTRSFSRIDPVLPSLLEHLKDGDRSLIPIRMEGETSQIALYATEFTALDRTHKLISFQNIRDELEQREVEFSQRLITVLTHEIMNSVTPIIALTKVIEETLVKLVDADLPSDVLPAQAQKDLLRCIASIQSRGNGLLRFVQAYSKLTNLPRPKMEDVRVAVLLEEVEILMAHALESANITLERTVEDSDLRVYADPEQLQQVLINIVKNAIEALADRTGGRIQLRACRNAQGRTEILVIDNGPGIDESRMDKIFVPFYTTKRRGSGVGLSVCRQIVFLNKGWLSVKAAPGGGCEFTMRFR